MLTEEGLPWLEQFRNPSSALRALERENWELFLCFPMMRSYGAKHSPHRLTYLAQLFRMRQAGNADRYLKAAEAAIDTWYVEHLRPNTTAGLRAFVIDWQRNSRLSRVLRRQSAIWRCPEALPSDRSSL